MRVTDQSIDRAIEVLCQKMRVPRPGTWRGSWSMATDEAWIQLRLRPAFLAALEEIEEVSPCYGFGGPKESGT